MANLARELSEALLNLLDHTAVWEASTQPFLPFSSTRGQTCIAVGWLSNLFQLPPHFLSPVSWHGSQRTYCLSAGSHRSHPQHLSLEYLRALHTLPFTAPGCICRSNLTPPCCDVSPDTPTENERWTPARAGCSPGEAGHLPRPPDRPQSAGPRSL